MCGGPDRRGGAKRSSGTWLLLIAAALLLGSSASAGSQTNGDESELENGEHPAAQELADRYAPVLMLKEQDEACDPDGEPYAPAVADIVLDNRQILLRQQGQGDPVVLVGPAASDIFDLGEGFYLDFPGDALAPGCIYERDFDRYTRDRPATVYAHIVGQADQPDRLAIQYWFFYYYNDYNNKHEGDWEGIQLLFDVGTVDEALLTDPVSIGYSQHFGGERAEWDGTKLERQATHPVVYVAVGSHASYYESALYLGRRGSEGFGCDNTQGPSVAVEPEIVVLPHAVTDPEDPFAWLSFEGKWGELRPEPFAGPTGPTSKPRWTAPVDWHDDLRSSSVAVPGGEETDTPVVNSFCGVVGWGSAQLIAVQRNPLRVLGSAFLAALVAFVVLRRTSWTKLGPLPIVRRRRIGQIVRAAADLYRHDPRRLLSIGMIYVPIALAVGAVTGMIQVVLLLATSVESDGNLGPIGLLFAAIASGVGQLAAITLVAASVAAAIGQLEQSGDVNTRIDVKSVFAQTWDRLGDLFAAVGLAALIVGGSALTVVGLPIAIRQLVRYQFLGPVTMLEGLGGRDVLERSSELVKGRWVHTAAATALLNSIGSALSVVAGLVLLLALAGLPLWVFSIVTTLVSALLAPFAAIGIVLLYGDAAAEPAAVASDSES